MDDLWTKKQKHIKKQICSCKPTAVSHGVLITHDNAAPSYRYGYMACPCRLAGNDREKDKDIICPCEYRAPDLEEYGACFCGLYVSQEMQDGQIETEYVPERRPPEKMF